MQLNTVNHADLNSLEVQHEFEQITRASMLRFLTITQSLPSHEQLDHSFVRLLHNNYEIKEHIIREITNLEIKSDNHYLAILSYIHDLVTWASRGTNTSEQPNPFINQNTFECIVAQATKLLNYDKLHYSLNNKRCQLICTLMKMPYCLKSLEIYGNLYKQLQNPKQFFPQAVKEEQKKLFMKGIQESLQVAGKKGYTQILQYVHHKIVMEIYNQQYSLESLSMKLRIIKLVLKNLNLYHEQIVNSTAFLLVRFNSKIIENYGFATIAIAIYENIMERLIETPSIVPLCLYCHVIINNLLKLQKNTGMLLMKQILLSQVLRIFQIRFLKYFLKYYDWNFMEEDICLNSLKILYEYTEDHSNQKHSDYELYKKHLTLIQHQIEVFIKNVLATATQQQEAQGPKRETRQFYDLKVREYRSIVQKINNKPKEIFKTIDKFESESAKQQFIQKVLKILKKSRHIESKSMINILSAGNDHSDLLMDRYLETFTDACKGKNLEQFIRLFTSNFFLWGEAQQIARVIDKLTVFYCNNQKKQDLIFKDSDVSYTFANAIIILNTDIHNPKNENKMTIEAFLKMCQKINQGEDLPSQMIKQIYYNIKHDEILTFRDCYNMHRINYRNWFFIARDVQSVPLTYFDYDMNQLSEQQFFSYAYELLTNLIDEKETAKLEIMVERFEYTEKKFDCEIIEKIRVLAPTKPHIAMHILQKVYEQARFPTRNIDDQLISFYWLAGKIIENFHEYLPYSKICEFLLITWRVGYELKDTLKIKEQAVFKEFKKLIRQYKKRQTKKSIMDMFSKFLGNKDSDDEEEAPASPNTIKKKINYANISSNILEIILKTSESKTRAAQCILMSLRQEEAKRYQEFLSCLYLLFFFLKDCEGEESNEILIVFFEEILNFEPCRLGQRIQNLKKKSSQKHQLLQGYCLFWGLKLFFNPEHLSKNNKHYDRVTRILKYSGDFLKKCRKATIEQFIQNFSGSSPEQSQELLEDVGMYNYLGECAKSFELKSDIFVESSPLSPSKAIETTREGKQEAKNEGDNYCESKNGNNSEGPSQQKKLPEIIKKQEQEPSKGQETFNQEIQKQQRPKQQEPKQQELKQQEPKQQEPKEDKAQNKNISQQQEKEPQKNPVTNQCKPKFEKQEEEDAPGMPIYML